MKNLLVLYQKICQTSPLSSVFSKEVILVHNQGMQHWLNLALAQGTGISMNLSFSLPSQYFWQLLHQLALPEQILDQAPYSREVLVWRIEHLLQQAHVIADPDFAMVTNYWQTTTNAQQAVKRFELAKQLADLFEQYLVFRPDWLDSWQHNQTIIELNDSAKVAQMQAWQAKLWRYLTEQLSYNPLQLVEQAIDQLAEHKSLLPERIACFGINNLPPLWLNFLQAISDYTQVHFFQLNPCSDYWGDILTEKQASKNLAQWQDLQTMVGNPLLANWGQQGREFLHLIEQVSHLNIDAFEPQTNPNADTEALTLLQQIQQDILTLNDARADTKALIDDSIHICSSHSELREVQGLHDWLLHQFNQDPSLTPKDVLVMCPQVEQYAPYVEAVFAKGWRNLADDVPPLPCSIADRVAIDSDPVVTAFFEMLSLPDSRFSLSQLIAWLRLTPLQHQLEISAEQVEQIIPWLTEVAIHWGIDAKHKAQFVEADVSSQFTWQQGLERLLLGFAYGEQALYQDKLVNPLVEGEQTLLLGKIIYLLEQLVYFRQNMLQTRSAEQWHVLLTQLMHTIFEQQHETVLLIQQALADFQQACELANYSEQLPLTVVKAYLQQQFSQPDTKQQFMVGQITFCSMLPMRSIPFKIIAVLGLNDGDFPRQRQQSSFDLMQLLPARLGDRSRRGDDRYLFLEALISAREKLYLSYQGHSVRTNKERQPSLVLQELMHYLAQGYQWSFDPELNTSFRQLPLQAFSLENYQGQYPSFDQHWLTLALQQNSDAQKVHEVVDLSAEISIQPESTMQLTLADLVNTFNHSAKAFVQHVLPINFEQSVEQVIDDTEPFVEHQLDVYQLRQQLLRACLAAESEQLTQVISQAKSSGYFPELPNMDDKWQDWQQSMLDFSAELKQANIDQAQTTQIVLQLSVHQHLVELTIPLTFYQQTLVSYRPSSVKFKDRFICYLQALALHTWQQQSPESQHEYSEQLNQITQAKGWFYNTKSKKIIRLNCQLNALDSAHWQYLLSQYLTLQQRPLAIHGQLCEAWYNASLSKRGKKPEQALADVWLGNANSAGLCEDAYIRYCQLDSMTVEQLQQINSEFYQPVLSHIMQE